MLVAVQLTAMELEIIRFSGRSGSRCRQFVCRGKSGHHRTGYLMLSEEPVRVWKVQQKAVRSILLQYGIGVRSEMAG